TKLTPLTTRPPVTSRQGIMRLASILIVGQPILAAAGFQPATLSARNAHPKPPGKAAAARIGCPTDRDATACDQVETPQSRPLLTIPNWICHTFDDKYLLNITKRTPLNSGINPHNGDI